MLNQNYRWKLFFFAMPYHEKKRFMSAKKWSEFSANGTYVENNLRMKDAFFTIFST
jgi:hypothetical protein